MASLGFRPSFLRILFRWVITVPTEMPKIPVISLHFIAGFSRLDIGSVMMLMMGVLTGAKHI